MVLLWLTEMEQSRYTLYVRMDALKGVETLSCSLCFSRITSIFIETYGVKIDKLSRGSSKAQTIKSMTWIILLTSSCKCSFSCRLLIAYKRFVLPQIPEVSLLVQLCLVEQLMKIRLYYTIIITLLHWTLSPEMNILTTLEIPSRTLMKSAWVVPITLGAWRRIITLLYHTTL